MVPSFIETQDIWEINLPSKLFSGRVEKNTRKKRIAQYSPYSQNENSFQ